MKLTSSRLLLQPINLLTANIIIKNKLDFFSSHNIPFEEDWPSIALKAYLPFYIELLENDKRVYGYGPWLIREKKTGEIVGDIAFKKTEREQNVLDIGYQLVPKYRNAGYATEAVSALCDWAFTTGIDKVTASCDFTNKASQKVLERNGFNIVSQDTSFIQFVKEGFGHE